MLRGIRALHDIGILHRDIKPGISRYIECIQTILLNLALILLLI